MAEFNADMYPAADTYLNLVFKNGMHAGEASPYIKEMYFDDAYTSLFYRHCEDTHTYFSTGKAGEIYTEPGIDVETTLNLTSIEDTKNPLYFDTNCFSYEKVGVVEVDGPGLVRDRKVSSTNFAEYPKGGIKDGFWYSYIGTNETLDFEWNDEDLRSVPDYNIDINTSEDLSIGDVAGASFTVQVQGTVKELIKYLGRKCHLWYDFKNAGEYSNYGTFTISEITFANHSVSNVIAYDNIKKFDKPVLDYLLSEEVQAMFPMTAKEMWHLMCDYCEVPYNAQDEFLNSDAVVNGAFGDNNLTARQVVSYIAQIACGYIACNREGLAEIRNLLPTRRNFSTWNKSKRVPFETTTYSTFNKNLPPLYDYEAIQTGASSNWTYYSKGDQKTQVLNEFPIELMDTVSYNSANGTNFINFRKDINSILDISDNPFIFNVEDEATATRITDNILDQFWLVYPIDREYIKDGYEVNAEIYNGDISTFDFDLDDLGITVLLQLTNNRNYRFFIPTGVNVSATGVSLKAKGQSTYSQKMIDTELTRQVDVIRNAVKETRLLIPDALPTTLNEMNEDIDNLQDGLSSTQSEFGSFKTNTESNISSIVSTNESQWTSIRGNTGSINSLQSTVNGLNTETTQNTNDIQSLTNRTSTIENTMATQSYVDDNNSITSNSNSVSVESGGQTLTLTADAEGYLTISFGDLSWKLKLEQETEGN